MRLCFDCSWEWYAVTPRVWKLRGNSRNCCFKLQWSPSLESLWYLSEILIQQYSTLWLCVVTHQATFTARKVNCVKVVNDAAEREAVMIKAFSEVLTNQYQLEQFVLQVVENNAMTFHILTNPLLLQLVKLLLHHLRTLAGRFGHCVWQCLCSIDCVELLNFYLLQYSELWCWSSYYAILSKKWHLLKFCKSWATSKYH